MQCGACSRLCQLAPLQGRRAHGLLLLAAVAAGRFTSWGVHLLPFKSSSVPLCRQRRCALPRDPQCLLCDCPRVQVRVGNYRGEEIHVPFSSLLPMVHPNDFVLGGWDISGGWSTVYTARPACSIASVAPVAGWLGVQAAGCWPSLRAER